MVMIGNGFIRVLLGDVVMSPTRKSLHRKDVMIFGHQATQSNSLFSEVNQMFISVIIIVDLNPTSLVTQVTMS